MTPKISRLKPPPASVMRVTRSPCLPIRTLALMTKARRPNIRIVFTAVAETERYTEGIGEFLPMPVHIPDLVATVLRLLPKPPASAACTECM
jgi:hypothetical protein